MRVEGRVEGVRLAECSDRDVADLFCLGGGNSIPWVEGLGARMTRGVRVEGVLGGPQEQQPQQRRWRPSLQQQQQRP